MASKNKDQIRLQVEPGNKEKLQDLARQFGLLHKAGPGTGKIGSLSSLLDAIASGKLVVLTVEEYDEYHFSYSL